MLAEHLLAAWAAQGGRRRPQSALVPELARMLGEQLEPSPPASTAARRLAGLVDRLNQLHYRSRWEAGSEGPRLIFGHCPYAAVVDRHPELCQIDAQSIAAIVDAEVQQNAKIDPSGRGAHSCVFSLKYR
jgi:predicted ArsR family transcriptional regulator